MAEVGVSISGMPGPALGAFVADDDHVALDDLLSLERGEHVFFAVVDLGRAAEAQSLPCR